jgi:hypothetical protein
MQILVAVLVALLLAMPVYAGSKKYASKGAGQSERSSVMAQQERMSWIAAGCPPLIQPSQKGGNNVRSSQTKK